MLAHIVSVIQLTLQWYRVVKLKFSEKGRHEIQFQKLITISVSKQIKQILPISNLNASQLWNEQTPE